MRLFEQIEQARKIRAFVMKEAPQDKNGNLMPPYKGWIGQLDHWIDKGERWLKENLGSRK